MHVTRRIIITSVYRLYQMHGGAVVRSMYFCPPLSERTVGAGQRRGYRRSTVGFKEEDEDKQTKVSKEAEKKEIVEEKEGKQPLEVKGEEGKSADAVKEEAVESGKKEGKEIEKPHRERRSREKRSIDERVQAFPNR